jgi:hypothetical protein
MRKTRATCNRLEEHFADFPNLVLITEGHCDDCRSAEYNLAAWRPALERSQNFLVRFEGLLIAGESSGLRQTKESYWQRNRRVHFSAAP